MQEKLEWRIYTSCCIGILFVCNYALYTIIYDDIRAESWWLRNEIHKLCVTSWSECGHNCYVMGSFYNFVDTQMPHKVLSTTLSGPILILKWKENDYIILNIVFMQ